MGKIIISSNGGATPEDPEFFNLMPFPGIQYAGGFDHLDMPDYLIGTPLGIKWKEVVKKGRYGEGYCLRIDGVDHLLNGAVGNGPRLSWQGPTNFTQMVNMLEWGMNTLDWPSPRPNGYNCVVPSTKRMHIYQKPDSNWLINTNAYYMSDKGNYPRASSLIIMINGQLREYADMAAGRAGVYTVLGNVPDSVNQWYSLEIKLVPHTPLVLVENPVLFTGPIPSSAFVDAQFQIVINGVTYVDRPVSASYTDTDNYIQYWKNDNIGDPGDMFHQPTNSLTYIDNYYAVQMTPEGVASIQNNNWVIRTVQPYQKTCRGHWTGLNEETGEKTIEGVLTEHVKFNNNLAAINSTQNTVYTASDIDPLETVIDGSFSKFYYEVPIPIGSIATWSFVTTLENIGTSTWYTGTWVMREGHPAWQDPDVNNDGASMEYRSAMTDPYAVASLNDPANTVPSSDVYYKLLPYGYSKGAINIGTSYPGNIPYWNR